MLEFLKLAATTQKVRCVEVRWRGRSPWPMCHTSACWVSATAGRGGVDWARVHNPVDSLVVRGGCQGIIAMPHVAAHMASYHHVLFRVNEPWHTDSIE